MLNVDIKHIDDELYVALEGRLDSLTSKQFARQIDSELDNVQSVVLDFANLDYISSAGLRILASIAQHLDDVDGEDPCVRNATGDVLETMEMTGLRNFFKFE